MLEIAKDRTLGLALFASVVVHGAVAATFVLTPRPDAPAATTLPIELVSRSIPAPATPSREPAAEEPATEEPPPPEPPPKEEPAPPPRKKPRPRPIPVKEPPPVENVAAPETGLAVATEPGPDAGETAPSPPEPGPAPDLGVPAFAALDLRPHAPGGARVIVVLRTDRLRDTPYAAPVEKILRPMPDYQTIVAGTGIRPLEAFSLLLISSPEPTDVTATFLAARVDGDPEALKAQLTGEAPAPRVTWRPRAGGLVGSRAPDPRLPIRDPRLFFIPRPGWILLSRPEILKPVLEGHDATASQPSSTEWLARLDALVDATTADAGAPIAVVGFAGAGERISLPGGGALTVPHRITLALRVTADGGVTATATTELATEDEAARFAASLETARREATDRFASRFVLHRVHALEAVKALEVRQVGRHVVFQTRLSAQDARLLLDAAAGWSLEFFRSRGAPAPRSE